MRAPLRLMALAAAAVAVAPAYYHWVTFQTRTAPYTPVYAHFDRSGSFVITILDARLSIPVRSHATPRFASSSTPCVACWKANG